MNQMRDIMNEIGNQVENQGNQLRDQIETRAQVQEEQISSMLIATTQLALQQEILGECMNQGVQSILGLGEKQDQFILRSRMVFATITSDEDHVRDQPDNTELFPGQDDQSSHGTMTIIAAKITIMNVKRVRTSPSAWA